MDSCSNLAVSWTSDTNDVCGDVTYTVRLLQGGEVVRVNTTMENNFNFLSLNDTLSYSVNITASNMAGDSDPVSLSPGLISIETQGP